MASGLGGAKAGILAGMFLAATVALFDWAILESSSGAALQVLSTLSYCSGTQGTAQGCFTTLINTDVPTLAILLAVAGIMFGGLYGVYFEWLPGTGYRIRAAAIGIALFVVMLTFGLAGYTVNQPERDLMSVFDLLGIVGYILILSRYYRKYTREVRFESPDPSRLKITVDGKNFTGKVKTLSLGSTHTIRGPSEGATFHAWLVSGGVSVLDPRSFETTLRVDGDGLLKIS